MLPLCRQTFSQIRHRTCPVVVDQLVGHPCWDPDPGLCYTFEIKKLKIILEIFFENNLFLNYKKIIRTENNFLASWVSEWWIYVLKLAHIVTIFFYILYLHPIRIRIHNMIINKTEKICLQDFIELLCRFYFIRDIWAKLNK